MMKVEKSRVETHIRNVPPNNRPFGPNVRTRVLLVVLPPLPMPLPMPLAPHASPSSPRVSPHASPLQDYVKDKTYIMKDATYGMHFYH